MTDRDKLIHKIMSLKKPTISLQTAMDIVDAIIDYGVIVPPCKVGDKVWDVYQRYNGTYKIREGKISMFQQKADKSFKFRITVNSSVWDFKVDDIGIRYFFTKEEAEEKLKELGK